MSSFKLPDIPTDEILSFCHSTDHQRDTSSGAYKLTKYQHDSADFSVTIVENGVYWSDIEIMVVGQIIYWPFGYVGGLDKCFLPDMRSDENATAIIPNETHHVEFIPKSFTHQLGEKQGMFSAMVVWAYHL